MVGMYYKRREERSQNKFLRVLSKYMINVFAILIIGFVLVVFFINGDTIKRPLSAYLSKVLDTEVSIGSADFSPLYPNVMRLSDINFGSSKINELYVEYDVMSLINSDELMLQDLYINGMTLNEDDWLKLKKSQLGFTKVQADLLRLNHIPLHIANIKSNDLNLRLEKASYANNELSFSQGRMNALEAQLFGEKVTNLGMVFQKSNKGFFLKELSVGLMGGTISGSGVFHPADLDKLLASTPDKNSSVSSLADDKSTISFKHGMQSLQASQTLNASTNQNTTTITASQNTSAVTTSQNNSAVTASQNNAAATTTHNTAAVLNGFQGFDSGAYVSSLGVIQPSVGYIDFDNLYLTKIIMPKSLTLPGNISVTAKNAVLSDVIVTSQSSSAIKKPSSPINNISARSIDTPQYDAPENIPTIAANVVSTNVVPQNANDTGAFVLQGINGNITDFKLEQGRILGSFIGHIDEISLPNLQTVFEQNQGTLHFNDNNLDFDLTGRLYEGDYAIDGVYTPDQSLLVLNQLKLNRNKLELTKSRWNFLSQELPSYYIKLGSLTFNQLEFLSYINDFPVSVQSISGNAVNWVLNNPQRNVYQSMTDNSPTPQANMMDLALKDSQAVHQDSTSSTLKDKLRFNVEGDQTTNLNLELINVLYSNLRMRSASCKVTLVDDILNIDLPKVRFDESYLSAQASIGLTESNAESSLSLKAYDFETADLNSNLINHLLTGKINLDVELKAQHDELDQIWHNLEGKIALNSDILLISDFGLDLINGGPQKNYVLTGTELMSSMQGNAAGINNLKLSADFINHQAYIYGSMSLATAFANFSGQMDLNSQALQGESMLASLAQDSTTKVDVAGTWQNPSFTITALKRGAQRPGLYLPQYEASAFAKEPTDTLLRGFEDVVPVPTDTNTAVDNNTEPKAQTTNTEDTTDPTSANNSAEQTPNQNGGLQDNQNIEQNDEQNTNQNGGQQDNQNAMQGAELNANQNAIQSSKQNTNTALTAWHNAAQEQNNQANEATNNTDVSAPTAAASNENGQSVPNENTVDTTAAISNTTATDSANQSHLDADLTNAEHNVNTDIASATTPTPAVSDAVSQAVANSDTNHDNSSATSNQSESLTTSPDNFKTEDSTAQSTDNLSASDLSKLPGQLTLPEQSASPEQSAVKDSEQSVPNTPAHSTATDNQNSAPNSTDVQVTDKAQITTDAQISTDSLKHDIEQNQTDTLVPNQSTKANASSALTSEQTQTNGVTTADTNAATAATAAAASDVTDSTDAAVDTANDADSTADAVDTAGTATNNAADNTDATDTTNTDGTVGFTDNSEKTNTTIETKDTPTSDTTEVNRTADDMNSTNTDTSVGTSAPVGTGDAENNTNNGYAVGTDAPVDTDADSAVAQTADSGATSTSDATDMATTTDINYSDLESQVVDNKTAINTDQSLDSTTSTLQQTENQVTADSKSPTAETQSPVANHMSQETSKTSQPQDSSISDEHNYQAASDNALATQSAQTQSQIASEVVTNIEPSNIDSTLMNADTPASLQTVNNQAAHNSMLEPSDAAVLNQQSENANLQKQAENENLETQIEDENLKKQVAADAVKNQAESDTLKQPTVSNAKEQQAQADALQRQAETEALKKQADEIENNLLEKALFDSFFSFQEQDEQDKLPQDAEKKSQQIFKFNNSDDEMIF